MKLTYREDKAVQAAALFLKLRGNNSTMSHLKLMKLLYLAEREALLRWGQPITYDSCVSMAHGPVLSNTLNLVNGYVEVKSLWGRCISTPEHNEVKLLEAPGDDSLSDAEEQLIRELFAEHGKKSRWELRDYTHTLNEWQDPNGSSIRIEYKDILKGAGKTDNEIESIIEELENMALMDISMGQQDDS
jgi:uncharacterized phage-associated protein